MIVTFRCPPHLKEQADALISSGKYPDFSTLCVIALENQILLEETHKESSTLIGKNLLENNPRKKTHQKTEIEGTNQAHIQFDDTTKGGNKIEIPSVFLLTSIPKEPPFELPSSGADIFRPHQEVPINRWIFGQYNRLLPAKVSIRALSIISKEGKGNLALDLVAPRIAECAAELGEYLRALDRRFLHHRDDALATAFPEKGTEGQKSRVRYQNHFVGHMVKGEQGGLLAELKLAVIHLIKNKPHIIPTNAGCEFARFSNPVLDAMGAEFTTRFGPEEIKFLLQHISKNVPVELFAYRVILSLIANGMNTPEAVNQGLSPYLSNGKKFEDELDFISTQRGGVLGRMIDLTLVDRVRKRTRISYYVTPTGKEFLDRVGTIKCKTGEFN